MTTTYTIFEILIIIGITQGIITSALLLTSKEKHQSKKILGVTVLVFCIANCRVILHASNLYNTVEFRFFPVGMELFLPPLVFLYILSLTKTHFKIAKNHFWHFVPGLVYALYDISLYLLSLGKSTIDAKDQLAEKLYFNQINQFEDYLIVVLTIMYVYFGYKNISRYLSWLKQFKNYKSYPIYGWLKSLIFWGAILGILLFINQLLDTFSLAMEIGNYRWRFFNLFIAFVTYYLGFMGYKNDGLKIHTSKTNLESISKKLSKSKEQEIETALLIQLNSEKVYLDSTITLKKLATELNITSENLSLVINQKFQIGFRDLISRYGINQVKELLMENNENYLSILDLALDSGFNSQASFYRAFKKFEGISPKAYIEKQSN